MSRNPSPLRCLIAAVSHRATGAGNPYVDLLAEALPAGFAPAYFSWRHALFGRYDLVHIHWPEHLSAHATRGPLRRAVKRAVALAWLARLAVTRVPVVRTVHNLEPHSPIASRWDRWLVRRLEGLTTEWIVLNGDTPTPDPTRTTLVPHPHYRGWFGTRRAADPLPGCCVFFGLIKPYKNVEQLIIAFRELPSEEASLIVAGAPENRESATEVVRLAGGDPRVSLDLRFLPDDELARVIERAELVVLPYTRMHNSGAILLALSLNCPVLAPAAPAVVELQTEVGEAWLLTFEGDISAAVLADGLHRIRRTTRSAGPDLRRRDPAVLAAQVALVYKRAVARRTPREGGLTRR